MTSRDRGASKCPLETSERKRLAACKNDKQRMELFPEFTRSELREWAKMAKAEFPNGNKQEAIRTAIIIPDMQVPFHDQETMKAVEKFMAAHRWDVYLNLGDFMDFDMISKFNKEALRLLEGRRIQEDYEHGNQILDRHQRIVRENNPNAEFVLLEGNHEERIERLLNRMPQFEGILEVEHGLRLEERGFKWVRCWSKGEVYKLGKAYFSHGQYTNKYHANKMVDQFGVNIFYGHTHDIQSMPKVLRGKDRTIEGSSLGCLCRYDQQYMKGRPSNWQQGFAVMHILPNGFFNLYVVRIFNHRFVGPDGVLYAP